MNDREKIDYLSIEIAKKIEDLLVLDKELVLLINKFYSENNEFGCFAKVGLKIMLK